MAYCTPSDLLWYGVRELSQLAAADGEPIDPELFRLACQGGDISGWTADAQAAVLDGVARVQSAIDQTAATINGYLHAAGLALPLSAEQVGGTPLQHHNRALARCALQDEVRSPAATEECQAAMAWLRDVERGAVRIGGPDVPTPGRWRFGGGQTRVDS